MVTENQTLPTSAYDLPIDIMAIGRQEIQTGRVTHRIGAHLFTADAQRVNDAMARHLQLRQETSQTLFTNVMWDGERDMHAQVLENASNMALFSQPLHITVFATDNDSFQMPTWAIVAGLALCAAVGFALALRSLAHKKKEVPDVY